MKTRSIGLDLVRTLAIIFVFCVHFMSYEGFYSGQFNNSFMFILLSIRWIFYTCVPLFLLLTGFLNSNKKLDLKYYKSGLRVISGYIFIEIIIFLFKRYYIGDTTSIVRGAINILGFTVEDYSWYVEMYIGLFLLIPFLNLIYNNLKSKKEKQWLIITMIILTSISPIFSYIHNGINIFPDYWEIIYPITYYFIGSYLKEYKLKLDKIKLIVGLLLLVLVQTIFTFFHRYNGYFDWNFMSGYGCITVIIISVLIFLILYDIDINNRLACKIITRISIYSFDMYLFSYIIDNVIYKNIHFGNPWQGMRYFPMVLITLILTFVLALIKDYIFRITKKFYLSLKLKFANRPIGN